MHLYDCIKSMSLRVPFGLAETGTCTCIIFLYYCNVETNDRCKTYTSMVFSVPVTCGYVPLFNCESDLKKIINVR